MKEEDRKELHEVLTDILATHTAEINGKFNVIHVQLLQIKEQTTKTNGRVTGLESKVQELSTKDIEHVLNCPQIKRIQQLENTEVSRNGVFKFITIVAGICATVATIVIAYFELKK